MVSTNAVVRLDSVPLSRWTDFHAGRLTTSEVAFDPVASRWSRVARTGLAADGLAHPDGVGKNDLDDRCARLGELLGVNGDVLQLAGPVLAARRAVVVLADDEGVILRARAVDYDARAAEARLVPGASWHEHARGTNAIGTAIEERRTVAIIGCAHYERANHSLFCYATPIVDPYGDVVGVVDVTGDLHDDDPAILDAVRYAGASLESALRASAYASAVAGGARVVERMLDRCAGPALLLEAPGQVRRANEQASRAFGIEPTGGIPIERLFGVGWQDLVRETTASGSRPIFEARGARYALTLDPIVGPRGRVLSIVVYADPLQRRVSSRPPLSSRSAPVTTPIDPAFANVAGDDPAIVKAKRLASRLARTNVPILLLAETGTGKELMARAVHQASPRAAGPFVALNCGSFTGQLLESELFGFAPGSFTGARASGHEGKIAAARDGTLFLDEIGEMTPALQAMLLRVLEDGSYSRVGETTTRTADFRLVCATCRDLPKLVQTGAFRSDLFYRIHGACIGLPPVRDRADRLFLASHLLESLAKEMGMETPPPLAEDAIEHLESHDWPGNVRELKNALRHALALADGPIHAEHFPEIVVRDVARSAGVRSVREAESDAMEAALRAANGNLSEAARSLGVSRSTLYRMMRRTGGDRRD